MLTLCWAAKGGSGTSVVAASLALATPSPSLLVDLAGATPRLLGLPEPDTPGAFDWLASDTTTDRLTALEVKLNTATSFLHRGTITSPSADRWRRLSTAWAVDHRHVIVDAGTLPPKAILEGAADTMLVTRACYLAVMAAIDYGVRPSRIALIREPGRSLKVPDVETALGAPVVSVIEWDPAIAHAADSGLLATRLPTSLRRELRHAA